MALAVPGALAYVFGWFAFRSRIKGVYFAIITQAMTFAMMLLFFRNNTGFGGNNGLTDFKRLLGFPLQEPSTRLGIYLASAIALLGAYLLCRFIIRSKLGRVLAAIRDEEDKVRFTGYDSLQYKLFVWTVSAVLCGLAGALYVPQVGIINPSEMLPAHSIEMAIWVAVGGRGTLIGAAGGALLVNGAKSWFTVAAPETWLYVLGGLFIGVTLFLPGGLASLWRTIREQSAQRADEKSAADASQA
jgi:urea transport system permease protein